ncbi:MAG: uracil-DNA glycosylase [Deltaproteobacteria bacterium]|nr:uracil-DNA glycosylase [Deltaproteobacteria bacterium]
MSNLYHTLEGFLPDRTLVMSKRKLKKIDSCFETQILSNSLQSVNSDLDNCTRCKLCHGRKTIVIGEGNTQAELVFVGEGPGEQEDIQGRPFVGRAGLLLDKMIVAMGLTREQVYICNVVKCRPPENRNPEPDEVLACSSFLVRQLAIIKPKVIVGLGKFAVQFLLNSDDTIKISQVRGRFVDYNGIKVMPTFHPAYLLRNPGAKREVWEDLQKVALQLGLKIPKHEIKSGQNVVKT